MPSTVKSRMVIGAAAAGFVAVLACVASVAAAAQRSPREYAVSRCSQALEYRMGRESNARNPDVFLDERSVDIQDPGQDELGVRGQGRFARDSNDRTRDFRFECFFDLRNGSVTRANYQWSSGSQWDDSYDRPDEEYRPGWSGRGSNSGVGNGGSPNGRVWFSGGIISQMSGKGLDVQDRSTRNAANVQQWAYAGAPNQRWDVIDLGRGEFAIISQGSNKALDVQDASTRDGANIQQYRWGGAANQRWRFERKGNGFFQIVNVGSGKCLDVTDRNPENGANIQQWRCGGGDNQAWRLQQ